MSRRNNGHKFHFGKLGTHNPKPKYSKIHHHLLPEKNNQTEPTKNNKRKQIEKSLGKITDLCPRLS